MNPPPGKQNRAIFILAAFFITVLLAQWGSRTPAQAGTDTAQAVTLTASPAVDYEGTPELLRTPIDPAIANEEPSRPGALLATGFLLMCSMIVMLAGGIGIAMVMVRLRNKIRG